MGRLRNGVSPEAATEELGVIVAQASESVYAMLLEGAEPYARPLHDHLVGGVRRSLEVHWAAVAVVLLIACANVSNLFHARGAARRAEIAVRLALGARRARLVRLVLAESAVVAAIGGGLALVFAFLSIAALNSFVPPGLLPAEELSVDGTVLAYLFLIAALTSIVACLGPALTSSQTNPIQWMRSNKGSAADSAGPRRGMSVLVVCQVALCAVLLISSALLFRSFNALRAVDVGFDADNVWTASINLPRSRYQGNTAATFYQRVLEQAQSLPGVEQASISATVPLGSYVSMRIYLTENDPDPTNHVAERERLFLENATKANAVSPNYFATHGIQMTAGRGFAPSDRGAGARVLCWLTRRLP